MKKRLLSMLLAAALAVSAVPAMALAVTAEDGASTTLLANVSYTGTAEVKTDTDTLKADDNIDIGDYYLSVTNRGRGVDSQGLDVLFGDYLTEYKKGQTWYMTFDARVPVESDAPAYVRTRLTKDHGNQNFWTSSDHVGQNLNIAYGGWKSYKIQFTNSSDIAASGNYRVWFRDGYDANGVNDLYHQPFDIDNVQFWAEDAEGKEIAGTKSPLFTFEDGQLGANFTNHGAATVRVNAVDPDSFTRIIGEASTPIVATYDIGSVDTNKYTLSGAVRFAYHDAVLPGETPVESTNVTVQLERNGAVEDLATLSGVGNDWVEFDANLAISSEDTGVKLIISADTALAIDLKTPELTGAKFEGTNAALIAVEGGLLAEDDVVISHGDAKLITGVSDAASRESGNYLHINGSSLKITDMQDYIADILVLDEETGAYTGTEKLYIEFDARVPVHFSYSESNKKVRSYKSDGKDPLGVQLNFIPIEGGSTGVDAGDNNPFNCIALTTEWNHYKVYLNEASSTNSFRVNPEIDYVNIYQGHSVGGHSNLEPMDIDNFKIYSDNRTVNELLTFDGEAPSLGNLGSGTIVAAEDFNRVQGWVDDTTIVYENVTLEPGGYTFTADLRNGYYGTAAGETKSANLVITAGSLGELYNAAINTEWTTIEKTFNVYKTTTIDLAITSDAEAILDYKNISLEKAYELETLYTDSTIVADEGNPLNGVAAKSLGTVTNYAATEWKAGEYLYIPERVPGDINRIVYITTPFVAEADKSYTMTFTLRTDAGVNSANYGATVYTRTELSGVTQKSMNPGSGTALTNEAQTFTYTFTGKGANVGITIRRGTTANECLPLILDDLVITQDGVADAVYTNNFATAADVELNGDTITLDGGLTAKYVYPLALLEGSAMHIVPFESDKSDIIYETDAIEGLEAGKYKLSTAIASNLVVGGAEVSVNLSDGTVRSTSIAKLGIEYTDVNLIFNLDEGVSVESIVIKTVGHCKDIVVKTPTIVAIDAVYGDADGDLEVGVADATILAKYIAKWDGFGSDTIDTTVLDVNRDNKVNSIDLIIMARHIGEWEGYENLPYDPNAN